MREKISLLRVNCADITRKDLNITRKYLVMTRIDLVISSLFSHCHENYLVIPRKIIIITRKGFIVTNNFLIITRKYLVITRKDVVNTRNIFLLHVREKPQRKVGIPSHRYTGFNPDCVLYIHILNNCFLYFENKLLSILIKWFIIY